MARPIVYGAAMSPYVWSVRLTLAEKGVAHELVSVGMSEFRSEAHLARNPFGKIPAFAHGELQLYEAGAITRYVDDAFAGPPLQPADPGDRARMNQVIGILDSYVYRTLVWDIYVEQVSGPALGRVSDQAKIAAALPKAEICLAALEEIKHGAPWLAGRAISLADLHAAPMFALFAVAPEGRRLMARQAQLSDWLDRMKSRPSFIRAGIEPRR